MRRQVQEISLKPSKSFEVCLEDQHVVYYLPLKDYVRYIEERKQQTNSEDLKNQLEQREADIREATEKQVCIPVSSLRQISWKRRGRRRRRWNDFYYVVKALKDGRLSIFNKKRKEFVERIIMTEEITRMYRHESVMKSFYLPNFKLLFEYEEFRV